MFSGRFSIFSIGLHRSPSIFFMSDDVTLVLDDAQDSMQKALDHLETELIKIRAGKASPQMLDGLTVDYYGSLTPLNQVGNVSVMDARTLTIQPWEKNMLQPIERSIIAANLGVTPQNDGNIIRLFMPPLTEERRKQLVKQVSQECEQGRVSIRSIRKETNEQLKKIKGASEDDIKNAEEEVQTQTNDYILKIDALFKKKEAEIMTV